MDRRTVDSLTVAFLRCVKRSDYLGWSTLYKTVAVENEDFFLIPKRTTHETLINLLLEFTLKYRLIKRDKWVSVVIPSILEIFKLRYFYITIPKHGVSGKLGKVLTSSIFD